MRPQKLPPEFREKRNRLVETKTFTGFLRPHKLREFGGGRLAGLYSDLVAVGTRVQIPPSALLETVRVTGLSQDDPIRFRESISY